MSSIATPPDFDSFTPIPPRRARHVALLALVLGLLLSLFFAGLNIFRRDVLHGTGSTSDIFIESFSRWMLYALLAPPLGALVARWPLARGRRGPGFLAHLGATAGLAMLHSLLVATIYSLLQVYPRGSTYGEAIARLLMTYFGVNFVIFWAIDGSYHALRYHHEVRAREQLAAELRARLSVAQLDGLRAQLNPHFLFNTLNAISSLALSGEREEVVRTLSVLSDLLRISLDRNLPQEIPLTRELDFLRSYLEIQQTRFGDRLAVELAIDTDAQSAMLPSLLTQPLVENAIQHGIAALPGPGRVVVRASARGGQLCVRVEDSGPGFANGVVARGDRGIGLGNTRARLLQLYGSAQSLECSNLAAGGAVVQVLLPLRHATDGDRA